jgi:hypothetical protein
VRVIGTELASECSALHTGPAIFRLERGANWLLPPFLAFHADWESRIDGRFTEIRVQD